VVHHRSDERYFVCNAGEHEPGTFKDRHLIKHYPHQLIEGCLIASFTVNAKESYIYLNAEFEEERSNFKKALVQARERGYLGKNVLGSGVDVDIEIFDGHGSYVAGEETAMLESMQGRPAHPKQKPPFYPTDFGLHGKPTLINNVETLSHVPHILRNGAEWFKEVGAEKTPGTMLFSLSGAVQCPGVYELHIYQESSPQKPRYRCWAAPCNPRHCRDWTPYCRSSKCPKVFPWLLWQSVKRGRPMPPCLRQPSWRYPIRGLNSGWKSIGRNKLRKCWRRNCKNREA